ncbi:MAG: hypothetical protein RR275_03470 [Lachnospiraceae bacterium]
MEENKEWATPTLKEVPFWREGMGVDEYDKEREYYSKNFVTLVQSGKYKPLWKIEDTRKKRDD